METIPNSASVVGGLRGQEGQLCNTLPFPANPLFYGRTEILGEISSVLNYDPQSKGIHSVAIWGTGGIGKTQIALQFANQLCQRSPIAVIWISSETESEISRCFNDAAEKLELPEYKSSNPPKQNRLLVLRWLQSTNSPWLLIFDNVEFESTLKENWPIVGNGCILVTCRSENTAGSYADHVIEIPTFSIDDGGALMLKIIDRGNIAEDEIHAAKSLSERLGGLPLAVDLMAKQIRSRKKSIREFIPYYTSNYLELHKPSEKGIDNPYYQKELATLWQAAFAGLSENAYSCMALLCFVAPESVPRWLLNGKVDLGKKYAFLQKEIQYVCFTFSALAMLTSPMFDDATIEVLSLSLIRINDETGFISMHRLIQQAFFDQLSDNGLVEGFRASYSLLREAFPDRSLNGHLYKKWPVCAQLSQHVSAWKSNYESLIQKGLLQIDADATVLIVDWARYIEEIGALIQCENIITPLLQDYPDKQSKPYALIAIEAGTLYDRTGRSILAFDQYETVYHLDYAAFFHTDPFGNSMANAYSRMNLATTGIWQGETGLDWINKAIECMSRQQTSRADLAKRYDADRFWRNRGRTNYLLGHYETAIKDFEEAERFQLLKHGADSHYDGESGYMFAKIYYKQKDWEQAIYYAQRAYDLMAPGKPNHATIIATRFLQAIILIARGAENGEREKDDRIALQHLYDALAMSKINESQRGNKGESARVKWRMSQILERQGLKAEAEVMLTAALEVKRSLQMTGYYPIPHDEEESWNALVGLLYR